MATCAGGAIGVRSRPGRGTALTVLLPAEVGDARVAEPRQVALVIDADASQHEVVNLAVAGANLVVQGPPGIGGHLQVLLH